MPQQRSRRDVFPPRRSGQAIESVVPRAVQQALRQRHADSKSLALVGDLERHRGDPRPIDVLDVAGHAYDGAVALIDRRKGLVHEVIDIGKENELALSKLALRREETPVPRL
jgi:hypothetical protein